MSVTDTIDKLIVLHRQQLNTLDNLHKALENRLRNLRLLRANIKYGRSKADQEALIRALWPEAKRVRVNPSDLGGLPVIEENEVSCQN
jgi:hypothetical protein